MTGLLIENVRFDDWRELDLAVVIADFGISERKIDRQKEAVDNFWRASTFLPDT